MAFEVARVHELICSSVENACAFSPFKIVNHSSESDLTPPRSYNPEGACVLTHFPADFSYDSQGFQQGVENIDLLSESPPLSTEPESDDGYDILQCLGLQSAQFMLGEKDANAEICPDVLQGLLEILELSSADKRVSPCLSSGGWHPGPPLSGGQSSSNGSSRTSSLVSSPSAPSCGFQDAWDSLDAAVLEVQRSKTNETKGRLAFSTEGSSQSKIENQALRAQANPQSRSPGHQLGRNTGSPPVRRKEDNHMVADQIQKSWHSKGAAMNTMASQGRCQNPPHQPRQQAFTPVSQQTANNHRSSGKLVDNKNLQRNRQTAVLNGGSGVRAIFIGGASGKEAGTGVFLPRTLACVPEQKRKTEFPASSALRQGCGAGVGSHVQTSKGKSWLTLRESMHRVNLPQPVVHEPCLPTEWTY